MRGWTIPQHINPVGEWDTTTFSSSDQRSCLDYWLISPSAPEIWTQCTRPRPGHQHRTVTIDVPAIQNRPPDKVVRPPLRWTFPDTPLSTCNPIDWTAVHDQISELLSLGHIDLAWQLWETSAHEAIATAAISPPAPPLSDSWYAIRHYRARITQNGEEGPRIRELYTAARRLLDFGKWGGTQGLVQDQA